MHPVASIIQGPSPEVLKGLLDAIESGDLEGGPAFCFDPVRCVFLMAIVEHGRIVHWQLEPARNQDEAAALQVRYMQAAVNVAKAMLDGLPHDVRQALEAAIQMGKAAPGAH